MNSRQLVFLFAIGASVAFLHATVARADALTLGWEDWRPYQFRAENGDITGLDIEIVQAVLSDMQHELRLVELPWKRHLLNIESGRTDLAASASRTAERETFAWFSAPYRSESAALFIRAEDRERFTFSSLADIIGTDFTLAVTRGYYYGEEFEQLMENPDFRARVQQVNDNQLAQRQLARGRVDGFLEDPIAANLELEAEGLLEQTHNLLSVYSDDIYVMFSKKTVNLELVQAFDSALEAMRKSGDYDEIIDKYLPRHSN